MNDDTNTSGIAGPREIDTKLGWAGPTSWIVAPQQARSRDKLERIMPGDALDDIITPLIAEDQAARLSALEEA